MTQYLLRTTACLINSTINLAFAAFFKVLKRIGEKDKNSLFKNVEKLCETKKQKNIDDITYSQNILNHIFAMKFSNRIDE